MDAREQARSKAKRACRLRLANALSKAFDERKLDKDQHLFECYHDLYRFTKPSAWEVRVTFHEDNTMNMSVFKKTEWLHRLKQQHHRNLTLARALDLLLELNMID